MTIPTADKRFWRVHPDGTWKQITKQFGGADDGCFAATMGHKQRVDGESGRG